MTNQTQKLSTKTKIIIAISGLLLGAAIAMYIFTDPSTTKFTDHVIEEIKEENMTYQEEVKQIEERVIRETRIVREQVQQNISALDPDALANTMVHEIMLWRGASSDQSQARSTWLYD
ncbi:MAG: hypothetical protein LBD57_04545 [Endomicrobium sp.]|jgi:hypothetical protein|uniref:hypothetical protein n=1 Tax=Candidatus Endomicrobiellum cubanum TaxID=3242325 RepID=UPI00281EA99D|nr:hypothetical protein [Endomicrobium sp.]